MMAQSLNDVKNVIGLWVILKEEGDALGVVTSAFYDDKQMMLRIEWEDGEVTFGGLDMDHVRYFKTREQAIQSRDSE